MVARILRDLSHNFSIKPASPERKQVPLQGTDSDKEITAMKNPLLAAACGAIFALGTSLAGAQVVVRLGPPAPVYERPGPPPHPGWEWHRGYHRWDGTRY